MGSITISSLEVEDKNADDEIACIIFLNDHGTHTKNEAKNLNDDASQLLALLGGLCSFDLFGATELQKNWMRKKRVAFRTLWRTFFARFLRSFRSLREGFSTLAASPDYRVGQPLSVARERGETESVPALDDIWVQTSCVTLHHRKSKRIPCFVLHQIVFGGQMLRHDSCRSCRE